MNTVMIATTPGREQWLAQCLASLKGHPAVVLSDPNTYELGKIKWMLDNTTVDRFLFLHDSVVVKDVKFFDLVFSYPKSVAISPDPNKFGMYMGVFHRDTLNKVGVPGVKTKEDAIYHEIHWCNKYCSAEDVPVLFSDFTDYTAKKTEMVFGRKNLVLENDYLIKYKGTWHSPVHGGGPPEKKPKRRR